MKRVTLGDIGKKLGLSHVAVSLALRNHPSLPERTKERVRQMAAEMGYRPDPALSSLIAYRQSQKEAAYQATLGWIYRFPRPREGHDVTEVMGIEGAKKRARKLGFGLEPFWIASDDDWPGLLRTLKSRRIEGLLFPPPHYPQCTPIPPDFPWDDFFSISVCEIMDPPLHLAINDQHQSGRLAVRELHALGYRKIGIVQPEGFAVHTEWRFMGGYFWECHQLGIPPLYLIEHVPGHVASPESTAEWILRHRPDAIIVPGPGDILPALNLARLKTPGDLAVATLCIIPEHPELAGIDQKFGTIGEAAVNQVVDLLRRNERGLPVTPLRHLVEGTWKPGPSAPPKVKPRHQRAKKFRSGHPNH